MGAAEGGVMPISHAMVASEVDPTRRGLAQGVAQNLGSNLLGSFAAPVVLMAFATAFGWREAFYLAGGARPAQRRADLVPAASERKAPAAEVFGDDAAAPEEDVDLLDALKVRNMWISVVVGVLMVAHFVITWAFMPLFLVQGRRHGRRPP